MQYLQEVLYGIQNTFDVVVQKCIVFKWVFFRWLGQLTNLLQKWWNIGPFFLMIFHFLPQMYPFCWFAKNAYFLAPCTLFFLQKKNEIIIDVKPWNFFRKWQYERQAAKFLQTFLILSNTNGHWSAVYCGSVFLMKLDFTVEKGQDTGIHYTTFCSVCPWITRHWCTLFLKAS